MRMHSLNISFANLEEQISYNKATEGTSVSAIQPADIAWVLTSTALVMLMVPALAFFYGGLVRRKNLVSTLVQCIIIFAVVSLVWFFWGYSFVYGQSIGGIIGFSPNLFGIKRYNHKHYQPLMHPKSPKHLFFAFQLKFAAITPALIIGACAERITFQILANFRCFVVNPHLLTHRPLGMER